MYWQICKNLIQHDANDVTKFHFTIFKTLCNILIWNLWLFLDSSALLSEDKKYEIFSIFLVIINVFLPPLINPFIVAWLWLLESEIFQMYHFFNAWMNFSFIFYTKFFDENLFEWNFRFSFFEKLLNRFLSWYLWIDRIWIFFPLHKAWQMSLDNSSPNIRKGHQW